MLAVCHIGEVRQAIYTNDIKMAVAVAIVTCTGYLQCGNFGWLEIVATA